MRCILNVFVASSEPITAMNLASLEEDWMFTIFVIATYHHCWTEVDRHRVSGVHLTLSVFHGYFPVSFATHVLTVN